MSKKKNIIILVLLFVLLIGGASVLYTQLSKDDAPDGLLIQEEQDKNDNESQNESSGADDAEQQLTKAPDFAVYDSSGNKVNLSDYIGKPIVLNFWASWCPPCKAEMPDFDAVCKEYEGKVIFMMVNLTDGGRDTVSGVREFVAANGYTFPVYFDTRYSAANAYRVSSIPTTYFINAEGEIVSYKVGMVSASELEKGTQSLLK